MGPQNAAPHGLIFRGADALNGQIQALPGGFPGKLLLEEPLELVGLRTEKGVAPAGLPAEQLVTLIIVGAMPAAVNVYIITDKMGGDGALACSAVVVTHLVSLFTMTGIVFAMRTAGLI